MMVTKIAALLAEAEGQINNDLPTVDQVAEYLVEHGVILKEDGLGKEQTMSKEKQSEWISVEENLPKNPLARCLVFIKDDDFTKPIGFNKIDTDRYIDGKWVRWGSHVTHWMPLPEPPKMEGE